MNFIKLVFIFAWFFLSCFGGYALCLVRSATWLLGRPRFDVNRRFCQLAGWGVLRISGVRVKMTHRERLNSRKPCVYVANHQSALDVITLGGCGHRDTLAIGKKEILWIPIFGLMFRWAGNVIINRQKRQSAHATIEAAAEVIRRRGQSIWIFPEGTRNRSGKGMLPFKKGAFHLAIAAQVPIIPVLSSPVREVFTFKPLRFRPGTVRLKVLPPIETKGLRDGDAAALCEKVRSRMLEELARM